MPDAIFLILWEAYEDIWILEARPRRIQLNDSIGAPNRSFQMIRAE